MSPFVRDRLLPLLAFLAGFVALALIAGMVLLPRSGHSPSKVGGPFALTDPDGKMVTQDALRGHPTLVFFGYTHCPDICPATLSQISSLFKAMGPNEAARAIFVTIDPQRDTPVVMKDYMTSFDPRIMGLTGTPAAIQSIESAYKVYAKAVPDKDGTYTMDHTAITYLMDKNGEFVSAFDLDRPTKDSAVELESHF